MIEQAAYPLDDPVVEAFRIDLDEDFALQSFTVEDVIKSADRERTSSRGSLPYR